MQGCQENHNKELLHMVEKSDFSVVPRFFKTSVQFYHTLVWIKKSLLVWQNYSEV